MDFASPSTADLPNKQTIGARSFWVRESEIGEECRQFGREFGGGGGGAETLEKQGLNICGKNSLTNSLKKLPAIFLKFAGPNFEIHPISALQNLEIKSVQISILRATGREPLFKYSWTVLGAFPLKPTWYVLRCRHNCAAFAHEDK